MTKKLVLNLEILIRKVDIKGIFVTKHWKEEIINHILQSDGELTNKKEEYVERGTPMAFQVSKAFGILEPSRFLEIATQTLNCHILWKEGELQKKWDTWKIKTPRDNMKK